GLFLILDRIFFIKLTSTLGSGIRILLTFFLVMFGWVLFRAVDFSHASAFYSNLFSMEFSDISLFINNQVIFILIVATILSFACTSNRIADSYSNFISTFSITNIITKSFISLILMIISVASLFGSDFNPFIYFRF